MNRQQQLDRIGGKRYEMITRLVTIVALLKRGGWWTLQQLSSRTRVNTRTTRRDLYALRRLGFDLQSREGHAATWRLVQPSECPFCRKTSALAVAS